VEVEAHDSGDEQEKRERQRLEQAAVDRTSTIDSLAAVLPEERRTRLKSISSGAAVVEGSPSSSRSGSRNSSSINLSKQDPAILAFPEVDVSSSVYEQDAPKI
jgi:hypothetical protein